MSETATIKLNLDSKNFAAQCGEASTNLLLIGTAGKAAAFGLQQLDNISKTTAANFVLGGVTADKFSSNIGKATVGINTLASTAIKLSDLAFQLQILVELSSGIANAANAWSRIPQTLQAMEASGVTTRSINEFQTMKDAFVGNQVAVDDFVTIAIARLGKFEEAAARSATVLKSSTRFDDFGNALRVNSKESMENALSIQNLVGTKLSNAVTSTEAVLAQYQVLSGGFTKQADSEKVLEASLKLVQIAKAGGMSADPDATTKLLTKTLSAYALSADSAATTAGTLNAVVENGITTIQELANGFGTAGSSASKAGISISELGAGVATLTNIGQGTDEALTGLKALSDTVLNKTPQASEELAKLSFNGSRIRFDKAEIQAKGFTRALIDLYRATGNSPESLQKIFPDLQSYRAAVGLLTADGAKLQGNFDSISRAGSDDLDRVAATASNNTVARMQQLSNQFEEIIISVAANIAPVVEPGLVALKRIADIFAAMPTPIKQAIGSWIAAQVTIKSSTIAVGYLIDSLKNLAQIYLLGRAVNLLFSGQLGAEATIIKELILQRKGLAAVGLQLIGIDQRHRLGIEKTANSMILQGKVAQAAYAAEAKGAEIANAARSKLGEIFNANVAGARNIAARVSVNPTANTLLNTATRTASAVANLTPVTNLRARATGFLSQNPEIEQLSTEIGNNIKGAFDSVKINAQKALDSTRATVNNKDYIPDPTNRADTVGNNVGKAINTAREKLKPVPPPKPDRASEIAQAQLNFQYPELIAQKAKLDTQVAAAKQELDSNIKAYETRVKEYDRKKQNLIDRAAKLEERTDLDPATRDRALNKLNQDALKLQQLDVTTRATAARIKTQEAEFKVLAGSGDRIDTLYNYYLTQATTKFSKLAQLEKSAVNLQNQANRFSEKATIARNYADNLSQLDPDSALTKSAIDRAERAEAKAKAINSRANLITDNYRSELNTSGGKTALLAQQNLQSVQFGGKELIVSSKGLENILYGDVGKNIAKFGAATVGAVTTGFTYVATNATRAAIALGNVAKAGLVGGSAQLLDYLKGVPQSIATAFKEGGARGLFNAGISGMSSLGTKALPMLPAPIAGAAGALAIPASLGYLLTKDDIAKVLASRAYGEISRDILASDNKIRASFVDRQNPLAQLKLGAEKLSAYGGSSDPLQLQLQSLRDSGQLTAEQFKELGDVVKTTGQDGKLSAENLAKFNAKLAGFSTSNKPTEKGVAELIFGGVIDAPGNILKSLGKTSNELGNLIFGTVGTIAKLPFDGNVRSPGGFVKSIADTQANRDAGYTIGVQSQSSKITNPSQDLLIKSAELRAAYSSGSAYDSENINKLATGKALTTSDIDREKLYTQNLLDRNANFIAGLDKQISELDKNIGNIQDPGQKEILQNQIKSLQANRDALNKNSESVKAATEKFAKYNLEVLPGLIRALTETKDPGKAVDLAAEDFNQVYEKDAAGKATSYFKDISKLRQDSAKYIDAIEQQYAVSNGATAEADAVSKLKEARDNKLTLPDGTTGNRETIANQIALTDKIVKIKEAESGRIIAAKNLEADRIKVLATAGAKSQIDAQLQSQDIAIAITNEQISAKEQEIQEYAAYPRKVVELEQQAAKLRINIEQQTADRLKTIRERDFNLRQARYDLYTEGLKTLSSQLKIGNTDYITQTSQAEIAKATEALNELYTERDRLNESSPELNNKIAQTEARLAQTQATSQTQIFDAQMAVRRQELANRSTAQKLPYELENKYGELQQKAAELRGSILNSNKELFASTIENYQQQLANESKIVNNSVARANIDLVSAKAKLANLATQQAYEKESLILGQKSQELGIKTLLNQLTISKITQQRNIAELELNRIKLDRDTSNSPESIAAKKENDLAVTAAKSELIAIDKQGQLLKEQLTTTTKINQSKLTQLDATNKTAQTTARIEVLTKQIEKSQSVITRNAETQTLAYTAQTNALTVRSSAFEFQTKQLENQSKLLSNAQNHLSAMAESRASELGNLSELTTIESVKAGIAERIAIIKLSSLNNQIALEKRVLELNIQQQQATLEGDKIKQQIAESQGESASIMARANLEKLYAKGNLADPNEIKAAQLDYQAKLQQLDLTRSNRVLLGQQQVILDQNATLQREQLQQTQKVKLQSAAIDYSKTQSTGRAGELQNELFNAGVRDEGLKYYQSLATSIVGNAPSNMAVPYFNSAYDPRSNYNVSGVANPERLAVPTVPSPAGTVDLTPNIPNLKIESYDKSIADLRAKYQNFSDRPMNIEVKLPAELTKIQQQGQARNGDKPVAPVKTNKIQLNSPITVYVADAKETKGAVTNSVLDGLYEVLKLVDN
ncbi:phage tail tape measure protein [Chamaesiphon sp. OTE_8_metabat_110]|uniref:phage tail tape measure protein n=1 Tax=Chamaesiphon sp. OTE_8_metabat_110 TaxID=2964696 RepID=UPI00286C8938|nr:phage tail tape measure protein [Chamaesiphon sp. OTE_8_metabat_110]